ncbi:hypothetical protein ILUMI_23997 [Ignelater luminosus]|uniref:Uncharacterized protein n=1 Tax=Ignelater luminosus TaxID=2038154 RepID=A0A8K0CB28_IGNLU|nr:hypothetical protein ILUMI_23997 [Ignelater luminosus]
MEDSKSAKVPAEPNSFLQKQENNPAGEVPYRQAVGMPMFSVIVSRLDIMFSVAQKCVSRSTTAEAEYVSASDAAQEA